LVDLVNLCQEDWAAKGRGPGGRDLHLLNLLGVGLQEREFHKEAVTVFEAARAGAEAQGDRYGVLHFQCQGAESCVALLDFQNAAKSLASILGVGSLEALDEPQIAVRAVDALMSPRANEQDLQILRIEAALALARYLAASGHLGSADVLFCKALELLGKQTSPTISADDVLIRLCEVRLDRGDFVEAEQLINEAEPPSDQIASIKWRILRAGLRHFQGRFSEADELLADLASQPQSASARRITRAAMWQRVHTLAVLNRLDEAEEMVTKLTIEGNHSRLDLEMARKLLDSRRLLATAALHLPPASHELLIPGEFGPTPPGSDPKGAAEVLATFRRRTRERVRDEWSYLYNQILLELHHGRRELAAAACAELGLWSRSIDSRIIQVRQDHLWALVYYYSGDLTAVHYYATKALVVYEDVGSLGDQWALCRILGWTLRRMGAPAALLEENREQTTLLQNRLLEGLSPSDRSLYSLNKWSALDEEISAVGLRLRQTLQRSTGPFLSLRYRRNAVKALQQIRRLRQLPQPLGGAATTLAKLGEGLEGPRDVYRLALESTRRRLTKSNDLALSHRLNPRWLPADTALLQYVVLPDRILLFLMTRRGCNLIALEPGMSRPHLWEMTQSLLRKLKRPSKAWRPEVARFRFEENAPAQDLSVCLGLPQVMEHLGQHVCQLAIIPDDILAHVPFAALPVNGEPLIAHFSVMLVPSLTWLQRSPWRPLFRGSKALGVAVTSSVVSDQYEKLDSAMGEIQTARQSWPADWTCLEDQAATTEVVRSALSNVQLAHFACHGDFFPDRPDESGLLLQDAWLRVRDTYDLRLSELKLAVLGSCWGASSTVLPGGIHTGLPFALLDAGALTSAASLWKVSDEANERFVQRLYRSLQSEGPIAAVATAQRESWAAAEPSAYWAGYVAYGAGLAPRQPWRGLLTMAKRIAPWVRMFRRVSPTA
jgi:CHAT domain-containing protein